MNGAKQHWDADVYCRRADFVPALGRPVLDLLAPLPAEAGLAALRRRALDHLAAWRPPSGRFRFLRHGIDPDLDDIALLHLVLQRARPDAYPYGDVARQVAGRTRPDGRFRVWLRTDPAAANDLDPCVGVNAARFVIANGGEADLGWLTQDLAAWDAGRDTLYYVQPYALPALACQLPAPVRTRVFAAAGWTPAWVEAAGDGDLLDAALRLVVACRLGTDRRLVTALARRLVRAQAPGGGWPAWAAFQAFNYWGSAALTTAAAVRALWDAERAAAA